MAVDGGSGEAEVKLPSDDIEVLKQMQVRTMSDPPRIRRRAPNWAGHAAGAAVAEFLAANL
jgi:hypothetical protein